MCLWEKEGDGDRLVTFHGIFSKVCVCAIFAFSNGTITKYILEAFLRMRTFHSTTLQHLQYHRPQGNYSENIY